MQFCPKRLTVVNTVGVYLHQNTALSKDMDDNQKNVYSIDEMTIDWCDLQVSRGNFKF